MSDAGGRKILNSKACFLTKDFHNILLRQKYFFKNLHFGVEKFLMYSFLTHDIY